MEHELRAKLLRLRKKAAGILSDRESLARLLVDSVSTFCVLFRHALMLHGVEAEPQEARDRRTMRRDIFGIDPAPFLQLLDVREEKMPLEETGPRRAARVLSEGISIVIDAVDRLNK